MPRKKKADRYTIHNKVRVIRGGADYFRLIEEIADNATYSLHLQTYIFDEDETGGKIAEALKRAAKRNVRVYMLLDGYASQHLSAGFISDLKGAGVHFGFFQPVFKSGSFYLGRRLHHKVVVADARVCMVAGINISNRYNDVGTEKAWLDWAIHAEGEIAGKISEVCIKRWNRWPFRKKYDAPAVRVNSPLPVEECLVRVSINDWVFKKTEITRSYEELFKNAHAGATVMTSYFWPPQRLLKFMARASRRGVKVKLVLTARADVPFAKYAERYLYRWLFRNNIEVYEYQKNILHGKIAVCDNEFVTAGSYNVNNISAFASVELNLDIKDTAIATLVNDNFNEIIENDCILIDRLNFWTSNNLLKKFQFYLSYRIIHIIFFLFTFYFNQRREKH